MRKMIANGRMAWGLNYVEEGDAFDAEDADAEVLEQVGLARRAKKQKKEEENLTYQTRALTAENPAAE